MTVVVGDIPEATRRPRDHARMRSTGLNVAEEMSACNSAKTLPASDQRPESSRPTLVVPQQPAERLVADDVIETESLQWLRRRRLARNRHVAETLVRPELVIIDQPLLYDVPQMAFAEDEEVVEDLMLGPLHPDFGERIQVWRPWRNGAKLDTIGLQDGAELGSELAVAVTDDVRGLKLGRLLGEDHAHVACDLGHPSPSGLGVMPARWTRRVCR